MAIARRGDIDGLRTLAIVPVVLYHASLGYFPGGFVGVDIFFVISGFLITSILYREISERRFSIINFYDRRARRLFPALFLTLAATSAAAVAIFNTAELEQYGGSLIATVAFVSNLYFWKTGNYFAPSSDELPLLHTWSLAVEEQFYIFFPMMLLLLARVGGKRIVLPAVVAAMLGSLALAAYLINASPKAAFYLLPARAWELLIGSVVALSPWTLSRRWAAEALSAAGAVAIAFAVFTYSVTTPFPGLAATPPCLGAAAIIFAGIRHPDTAVARVLRTRPFVWIGRISYSLYLWHWPILVLATLYAGSEISAPARAACVVAAFVMAWFSLKFVELPFQQSTASGLPSRINTWRPGSRVAVGTSVLALAALPGILFVVSGGLPGRLPPAALAAEAAARDNNPRQKSCLVGEDAPVPASNPCTVGPLAPDGYDTVLWGDSHADAFAIGVTAAGAKAGWTVRQVTKTGCPPLPEAYVVDAAGTEIYKGCRKFNEDVLAEIIDNPKVKTVILGGRWSQWSEGTERSRERLGAEHYLGDTVDKNGSIENTRRLLEQQLPQLAERLTVAGKRVILLGQAPEYSFSPAGCISRALLRSADASICSDRHFDQTLNRLRFSNELLKRAAGKVPGVSAVVPSDVLCNATSCRMTLDGRPIYRDDDHLNNAGARLVWSSAWPD